MEFASLDYSQVVTLVNQMIGIALPIGIVFGLAGKAVNFFMSMVLGKERVDL